MFTCPADNRVSLVDVWLELECLLARLKTTVCFLSRCLVGTRMFSCPAENRVSFVDVCLELECLPARLTTVFPWSMFVWN